MRFSVNEIPPQPWKNGGGTTRELVLKQRQGCMAWRISLAEIIRDGAFSAFPGLLRIHCITSGAGLLLSNSDLQLAARPLQPLHFDGGLALRARLNTGACQAFNVIYDPKLSSATMRVLEGGGSIGGAGERVLYVLAGQLKVQTAAGVEALVAGEGLFTETGLTGQVPEGAHVIEVCFESR